MIVFVLILLAVCIFQASTIAKQQRQLSSHRRALDALRVLWEGK